MGLNRKLKMGMIGGGPYDIPVDLVIDRYNPESWRSTAKHVIARAGEGTLPTIVLLQHGYGLDPDEIRQRWARQKFCYHGKNIPRAGTDHPGLSAHCP